MKAGSAKKIGIIRFLGTNCDTDIELAVRDMGRDCEFLWYQDQFDVAQYDALILPGGFSYGDYLRTGALASRSPVMKSVREACHKGLPVLGICNGFQILCESGLLPGVLLKNQSLRFQDQWVPLLIQNCATVWTSKYKMGEMLRIPIAHGEGRYYADPETLKMLQDQNQILCTYSENPNGSVYDIAGILNETKNVAGLMPHPERAMKNWMGSYDGRKFFEWMI